MSAIHDLVQPDHRTPAPFRRILLPTDGSELSLQALKKGMELAAILGAQVLVLHIVPPQHAIAYMTELLAAADLAYTREAVKSATGYLRQAKEMADAAGVTCECRHAFGEHPHDNILDAAREHHCDLIVMASHGRRSMDRVILGSETQKVLLRSEIPVLVCG